VGGQNAVSASGEIIGKGDLAAQAEQVLRDLQTALAAADADVEHLVKWTIHVVDGQPLQPAFAAFQRFWGNRPNPPLITLTRVSGLANPDFLVEIDAVAAVPE
jgi:enamine deaminase RidA (YjgF/YER057c/UK114 family)